MKQIVTFIIILVAMIAGSQSYGQLNLKLPDDLYYVRSPKSSKSIRMTIRDKLPSVLISTSDEGSNGRLLSVESFLHGQGKQVYLFVFPQLYNVEAAGSTTTCYFGRESAENNQDQAVVRVLYKQDIPSKRKSMNRKPMLVRISDTEMLPVTSSAVPGSDFSGKLMLKVEATADKPATLEISREAQRGNVLIAIISVKSGNLIATLNPKDPDNQSPKLSFTVDDEVLVIPVIRPVVTSSNGTDTVLFQVGDPREVATVTVSEE
jgi:hypothetical protein